MKSGNSRKELALSIFSKEPFFYESELPLLWQAEMKERVELPENFDINRASIPVTSVLHNELISRREEALKTIIEYSRNALSSESHYLPRKFYLILQILAETRLCSLQQQELTDCLTDEHKKIIHTALSEKWLDPDSRSALESIV